MEEAPALFLGLNGHGNRQHREEEPYHKGVEDRQPQIPCPADRFGGGPFSSGGNDLPQGHEQ